MKVRWTRVLILAILLLLILTVTLLMETRWAEVMRGGQLPPPNETVFPIKGVANYDTPFFECIEIGCESFNVWKGGGFILDIYGIEGCGWYYVKIDDEYAYAPIDSIESVDVSVPVLFYNCEKSP